MSDSSRFRFSSSYQRPLYPAAFDRGQGASSDRYGADHAAADPYAYGQSSYTPSWRAPGGSSDSRQQADFESYQTWGYGSAYYPPSYLPSSYGNAYGSFASHGWSQSAPQRIAPVAAPAAPVFGGYYASQPPPRREIKPPVDAHPVAWREPSPFDYAGDRQSELELQAQDQLIRSASGRMADGNAPDAYPDYYSLRLDVSHLTVDKLKGVIRGINSRLRTSMRVSGNKGELIGRVRELIEQRRDANDMPAFAAIRRELYTADPNIFRNHANTVAADGLGGAAAAAAPAPVATGVAVNLPNAYAVANAYAQQAAHAMPPAPVASTSAALAPGAEREVIAFRPSPFYTHDSTVCQPTQLQRTGASERKTITGFISLRDEQRKKLLDARASSTAPQYQIRLFCTTEDYYQQAALGNRHSFQNRGPAPVEFPPTCEAKINGASVPSNKLKGIKKREGTTMPPNLGEVKIGETSRALNLNVGATNRVELSYVNTEKRYWFLACLVRMHPMAELVHRVRTGRTMSKESGMKLITGGDDDNDIEAVSSEITLKCPLSFSRIETPVRSIHCPHFQTFDAESFLSVNEVTPSWNCPICDRVLRFADLCVDEYMQSILAAVNDSYDSVVVEADGTWRTEDYKHGTAPTVGQRRPTTNSLPVPGSPSERKPSVGRGASQANDAVYVLDDDSDDGLAPAVPRASTSYGHQPQASGSGAVIDLTLSDDEDDAPPPAYKVGQRRPAPDDFDDQGPPQRPRYGGYQFD